MLAALNGLELFGHERGNIEVYKAIRGLGADVTVAVNAMENGGDVGRHLRDLNFPTIPLAFGNQWSLKWLKQDPMSVLAKVLSVLECSVKLRSMISRVDRRTSCWAIRSPIVTCRSLWRPARSR